MVMEFTSSVVLWLGPGVPLHNDSHPVSPPYDPVSQDWVPQEVDAGARQELPDVAVVVEHVWSQFQFQTKHADVVEHFGLLGTALYTGPALLCELSAKVVADPVIAIESCGPLGLASQSSPVEDIAT
jgi:hypothetical protein